MAGVAKEVLVGQVLAVGEELTGAARPLAARAPHAFLDWLAWAAAHRGGTVAPPRAAPFEKPARHAARVDSCSQVAAFEEGMAARRLLRAGALGGTLAAEPAHPGGAVPRPGSRGSRVPRPPGGFQVKPCRCPWPCRCPA